MEKRGFSSKIFYYLTAADISIQEDDDEDDENVENCAAWLRYA